MSRNAYAEKFKDPRWQQKRLEILSRDKFECRHCGAKEKQLHVHHLYYIKSRDPWAYPSGSLVTLCFQCHERESGCEDYDGNTPREWELIFGTGIPCSRHEIDFAMEFSKFSKAVGGSVDDAVYELMILMQYTIANQKTLNEESK